MRPNIALIAAALLLLAGCVTRPDPHDPARAGHAVSIVNKLSWTNAMSGKPDGLRSAWPLSDVAQHTERFPLTQVKRCDAEGNCSWGVLKSQRLYGIPRFVAGGVALEMEVTVDVARTQERRTSEQNVAMTIPSDVSALRSARTARQEVLLEYGKVHRIDFDFGVGFEVCVLRLGAARQPVDTCAIPYI